MTAADIAADVRRVTRDASGVRWSDADILAWIGEGLRDIFARRPAACWPVSMTVTSPSVPSSLSDDVAVSDRFRAGLADYVIHKCYSTDEDDEIAASRSNRHLASYLESLRA